MYDQLSYAQLSALHYNVAYELGGPKEIKRLVLNLIEQANRANILAEAIIRYRDRLNSNWSDTEYGEAEKALEEALTAYQEGKV